MKRRLWISIAILLLGCGAVFAVGALEQAIKPKPELPSLLPEGALLSIEARDFSSLLRDWNSSEEKRAWISSDNHAAFSNSRLYERLSQAQDEFTAAAGLPADQSLLDKVAGKESCLALYDIGNLEFVYVTRLDQQGIENTPLWQTRAKFEQRSEAGSVFYVHKDAQSSRVAAFATRDGWLILGTREDLVAGVLDRMAGTAAQNLAGEGWFAEAVKQAAGEHGDLRMVLNLEKIVPSPYFRSYWVQRNVTEMKQYASAVSDLYRNSQSYREERVLVRRAGATGVSQGDVRAIVHERALGRRGGKRRQRRAARQCHRQGSGCGPTSGCLCAAARAARRHAAGGIARSLFLAPSARWCFCFVADGDGRLRRARLG